jgi:hypothetical protein
VDAGSNLSTPSVPPQSCQATGSHHRSSSFPFRPLDQRLNGPHTAAKLPILRYAKAGAAVERTESPRARTAASSSKKAASFSSTNALNFSGFSCLTVRLRWGLEIRPWAVFWWRIAHKKRWIHKERERGRPSSFARALFLSNTAQERVELLWIVSHRFEFSPQRRDIAKFRSRSLGCRWMT